MAVRMLLIVFAVSLFGSAVGQAQTLVQPRLLWIPLDSRPVNTDEVALLGQAAGLQVHLPPTAALDRYAETRADFPALLRWLEAEARSTDVQVLYTNSLLVGGLIASRDGALYADLTERLTQLRSVLADAAAARRIAVHVLPRALPTQFRPDGSFNPDFAWRDLLAERSVLVHRVELTGRAPDRRRLAELEQEIPPDVRERYDLLLAQNERALEELLRWVADGVLSELMIGLDDAQPFGMANLLQERALRRAGALGIGARVQMHYGADEIGFLLVAREALLRQGVRPRMQVMYDHSDAPNLYLPYEGAPLGRSVRQKLAFLGADTSAPGVVDRAAGRLASGRPGALPARPHDGRRGQTVFIHTPLAHTTSGLASQIATAVAEGRGITLVDVTTAGARNLTLLHQLRERVPLASMGYSGWNTASNSVGTGLAMAAIADLHRQRAPDQRQVAALIAFRALRYSYDLLYQGLEPNLAKWARQEGIDPHQFGADRPLMEVRLAQEAERPIRTMLADLYGDALVEAGGRLYAVCVVAPTPTFPWDRTFEARILPAVKLQELPRPEGTSECLRRP